MLWNIVTVKNNIQDEQDEQEDHRVFTNNSLQLSGEVLRVYLDIAQ